MEKIAYELPSYAAAVRAARTAPVSATEEEEVATAALSIYADMHNALCVYVKTYQLNKTRPTVETVRGSLDRLGSALAEVAAAWASADLRAKHYLCEATGERPFTAAQLRPTVDPPDAWARGVYRMAKFRDAAAAMAAGITAAKKDLPPQDRRRLDFPGLDELTERLAELFTRHTGRRFTASDNRNSATDFVGKVMATLPEQCRLGNGSIEWAMRQTIKRCRKQPPN